ncbi:hypothetical protein ABK040_006716 [Willaertia magna]
MDPQLMKAIQQLNIYQEDINKINSEIQREAIRQQSFAAQKNENDSVKTEFDLIDSDSGVEVYKLIGPVLVKQDVNEAKSNVDKRLEFINKEIENIDKKIEEGLEKKKKLEKNMNDLSQWIQQKVAQFQQQRK